ncbi:MAG TPA: hypothetical protein VGA61_06650 [Anaerolineae bacterium]
MTGPQFPLVVHATHEAHVKIGGIGAVLDGLLGSPAYNAAVARTIVVGAMNVGNLVEMERLTSPANRLAIIYSSLHGENHAAPELGRALRAIEERMNVRLLYGRRGFGPAQHEVILVDAQQIDGPVINSFKFYCWDRWGLDSARYETQWEYSFFMNAAEPLFAALEVVTGELPPGAVPFIIAHEWVGLPVVFSALLHRPGRYKTAFYAHEVAIARRLVEDSGGHDTCFYNALRVGVSQGIALDAVFGDQSGYFKHAVVQRAGVCDRLFAVGDLVLDELRFLGGIVGSKPIDLVYNGVPAGSLSVGMDRKQSSRELLLQYCQNLLGYRPDFVFSHVSRMVVSKAFWRDLRVLEHLDGMLAADGKRAVCFVVATADPAGRLPADVMRWEREYGWPLGHRADNGDLRGEEDGYFFHGLEPFHWNHHNVRIVLVNQFGWDRSRCGARMPEGMTFADLRAGTDLEFGQSIYEPFGIAQVEPLGAGALCVVSNVCGCIGFVRRSRPIADCENLIVADYTSLPDWFISSPWDALWIDRATRERVEARASHDAAAKIRQRLPYTRNDAECLLDSGQAAALTMSWDKVVADHLLPAMQRC